MLAFSQAATLYVAVEAEAGSVSGNAASVAITEGNGIKFGTTPSTGGGGNRPTLVNRQILNGPTGAPIKMVGVTVWGNEDHITGSFGADQYANRAKIVQTIKAWGGNHIRFRMVASDYDKEAYMSKATYIQQIKEWRDLTVASGMYFMPIWWDGLDGDYAKGNWASQYSKAFPMMTDVVAALGNDPMVIYEPFNEPTDAPSADQWHTAMENTIKHFRTTIGYTGILVIDGRSWSHYFDDGMFTDLENLDAGLTGMGGKHQLVFAKHDYANEGWSNPDGGFDNGHWAESSGGGSTWDFSKHAVWETEYGNYNGDPSTVHLAWSKGACQWFAAKLNDGTLVGASAFVWGPWYDGNAITASDNTSPTEWGTYVRDDLFGAVN